MEGDYDIRSVEEVVKTDLESLQHFTLVIGSNLHEATAVAISDFLFDRNVPFLHARSALKSFDSLLYHI